MSVSLDGMASSRLPRDRSASDVVDRAFAAPVSRTDTDLPPFGEPRRRVEDDAAAPGKPRTDLGEVLGLSCRLDADRADRLAIDDEHTPDAVASEGDRSRGNARQRMRGPSRRGSLRGLDERDLGAH